MICKVCNEGNESLVAEMFVCIKCYDIAQECITKLEKELDERGRHITACANCQNPFTRGTICGDCLDKLYAERAELEKELEEELEESKTELHRYINKAQDDPTGFIISLAEWGYLPENE